MVDSIRTVIEARDPHGQDFAFSPGERSRAVHQLAVQFPVMPHHRRVHRVDLDDVVRIGDPFRCGKIARGSVRYERQGRPMGGEGAQCHDLCDDDSPIYCNRRAACMLGRLQDSPATTTTIKRR